VIDDESLVKTRTNTCLSHASGVPSYSVPSLLPTIQFKAEMATYISLHFTWRILEHKRSIEAEPPGEG
jgi:hypothetical protein